jgi:hypothetical protein
MKRLKRLLALSLVLIALGVDATVVFAEERYSTLTGKVVGYRGVPVLPPFRRYLEIESSKDKAIVDFRIGKKTAYSPRAPSPGEKVKVEYLAPEGVPIAYRVTILE